MIENSSFVEETKRLLGWRNTVPVFCPQCGWRGSYGPSELHSVTVETPQTLRAVHCENCGAPFVVDLGELADLDKN